MLTGKKTKAWHSSFTADYPLLRSFPKVLEPSPYMFADISRQAQDAAEEKKTTKTRKESHWIVVISERGKSAGRCDIPIVPLSSPSKLSLFLSSCTLFSVNCCVWPICEVMYDIIVCYVWCHCLLCMASLSDMYDVIAWLVAAAIRHAHSLRAHVPQRHVSRVGRTLWHTAGKHCSLPCSSHWLSTLGDFDNNFTNHSLCMLLTSMADSSDKLSKDWSGMLLDQTFPFLSTLSLQ